MPRILTAFVKLPQKKRTFLGVNGFYLPGRYDIISQVCGQLCRTAGLHVFPERVPAPRMAPFDQGVSEKSKLSSISTNTARFCVKKPWNPQRIPAAFCLKFASCLRNIRHFLCFQIHLITLIPNMGIPLPRTEGTVRGNGTATFGLQMLPPFVLTASNRSQNQCGTKSGCSP